MSCEKVAAEHVKWQSYFSFCRSNLISCEQVPAEMLNCNFTSAFFPTEPHFVRKGCNLWILVGTAPGLKREDEKYEKKMWEKENLGDVPRCEDVKIRCADVKMSR